MVSHQHFIASKTPDESLIIKNIKLILFMFCCQFFSSVVCVFACFSGLEEQQEVLLTHFDEVIEVAPNFKITAKCGNIIAGGLLMITDFIFGLLCVHSISFISSLMFYHQFNN